jgi:hypothetical protein
MIDDSFSITAAICVDYLGFCNTKVRRVILLLAAAWNSTNPTPH